MLPINRSQFYTLHRQRHTAEYFEASRTYRENNRDELNAHQRNILRRNAEVSRLHNEKECLGKLSFNAEKLRESQSKKFLSY